ncbi:MAG TPA: hypothetical protein DD405_06955 [Desulfobacteraceae bacterium]|nr:hypothetical protein [Desulfobacteraceae bacterium]
MNNTISLIKKFYQIYHQIIHALIIAGKNRDESLNLLGEKLRKVGLPEPLQTNIKQVNKDEIPGFPLLPPFFQFENDEDFLDKIDEYLSLIKNILSGREFRDENKDEYLDFVPGIVFLYQKIIMHDETMEHEKDISPKQKTEAFKMSLVREDLVPQNVINNTIPFLPDEQMHDISDGTKNIYPSEAKDNTCHSTGIEPLDSDELKTLCKMLDIKVKFGMNTEQLLNIIRVKIND